MSSCMRLFCLLVYKLLSCNDLRTLDFFRNSELENSDLTIGACRFGQVSSAQYSSVVGNYSFWTIGHGKILSLAIISPLI